MTNQYHATPYDISAMGFYFSTYEEYQEKAAKHKNEYGDPVEEYEIQFIDGDNHQLFKALEITQACLKQWFDDFEKLDEDDNNKATYLAKYSGYSDMNDILDNIEDVMLFEGTALECAEEYIEDTGMLNDMPENLRFYFDTEAFAPDMVLRGDITEVEIGGTDYIAWGEQ
jgi:hypothetical protein